MLFNSLDFAVFLPVVFFLYWFICNCNLRLQNALIVVASYIFYGWWDWRFLGLIFFSTVLDYSIGRRLAREDSMAKRKALLWTSILINLGFLGFFKYYNFFIDNFIAAFSLFGHKINANSLSVILPVGISFYTFQTLSYTIDVYKKKLEPTADLVAFSAFVCFFPQLVAGPIERATNLLPQFSKRRTFSYALGVDGLRQILWGLFKKVVIADNCAEYANFVFNNYEGYNGSTLLLGTFFFAFQIYGDFSGYSDIAIGTSRLFGFNLKQNFAMPYFSRDIAEFWRRWHISLSTWFRDYVYIPLGGSRGGTWMKIRNTFIIFLVSGFWHGANWTFVVWGGLNALYFLPLLLRKTNRANLDTIVAAGKKLPNCRELFQMLSTFLLTLIAWIFFRSESLSQAREMVAEIFSESLFGAPIVERPFELLITTLVTCIFVCIEWLGRFSEHTLGVLGKVKSVGVRWGIYLMISALILLFSRSGNDFIYFQF